MYFSVECQTNPSLCTWILSCYVKIIFFYIMTVISDVHIFEKFENFMTCGKCVPLFFAVIGIVCKSFYHYCFFSLSYNSGWSAQLLSTIKGRLYECHSKAESTQLADLSRFNVKTIAWNPKWPILPLKSPLSFKNGKQIELDARKQNHPDVSHNIIVCAAFLFTYDVITDQSQSLFLK